MKLRPFQVTVAEGCIRSTVTIWTATAKAARESGAAYAREELAMRNPTIHVQASND